RWQIAAAGIQQRQLPLGDAADLSRPQLPHRRDHAEAPGEPLRPERRAARRTLEPGLLKGLAVRQTLPRAASDMMALTANAIRKTTNKILAMPAALAAIPPNPNRAATSAMTRKVTDQYNMV